jgi:hypothetical protein
MERYARGENGVRAEEPNALEAMERRRVIKALSSIPVLLTLGSGVARAQDSTYQCLTTTPKPPSTPTLGVNVICTTDNTLPSCDPSSLPWEFYSVPDSISPSSPYSVCSPPANHTWQCKYLCFNDEGTQLSYSTDCSTSGLYPATKSCYNSFPTQA